jgi:hypothetical protein
MRPLASSIFAHLCFIPPRLSLLLVHCLLLLFSTSSVVGVAHHAHNSTQRDDRGSSTDLQPYRATPFFLRVSYKINSHYNNDRARPRCITSRAACLHYGRCFALDSYLQILSSSVWTVNVRIRSAIVGPRTCSVTVSTSPNVYVGIAILSASFDVVRSTCARTWHRVSDVDGHSSMVTLRAGMATLICSELCHLPVADDCIQTNSYCNVR